MKKGRLERIWIGGGDLTCYSNAYYEAYRHLCDPFWCPFLEDLSRRPEIWEARWQYFI